MAPMCPSMRHMSRGLQSICLLSNIAQGNLFLKGRQLHLGNLVCQKSLHD